jgi:hypothetical protein
LLVIPPFARFWLWLISIQKDETHQAVHIEPLCCYVRTVESGKKRNGPLVRQVLSVGEKTENIPLASHHYRRHHSHVISPAIVWVCTHTSSVPAKFECPLILFVSVLKCLPFFSCSLPALQRNHKGKNKKKEPRVINKKVQRFLSMPSVGRGREKKQKKNNKETLIDSSRLP